MDEAIKELKGDLDELCQMKYTNPEFAYIDAIRFVTQYRIMRAMEIKLEETN